MSSMAGASALGQDSAALQEYIKKKLDSQAIKMSKRFKVMMKNKEVAQW